MKVPLANFAATNGEIGMYLSDAWLGAGADGVTPEQVEIVSIEQFDALVAERKPAHIIFGFFGYPRRPVEVDKARPLVVKLLRQYAQGQWGRFRVVRLAEMEGAE